MKNLSILVPILLASAALAGCADNTDDDPAGDDVGTATAVTLDAPKAAVGGMREVCWTVDGSGHVGHVAIHWDTESHADDADRTFQDYDAGAAYPDNHESGGQPAADPEGYDLPGTFCADVAVPATGSLYVVGHVIDAEGAPGKLSDEVTLEGTTGGVTNATYVLTTTGVPDSVAAGENFTFTLTVAGPPGESDHIGAHYGMNMTAGTGAPAADALACIHLNGTLPGSFQITCTIASAGTWYLRGHTRTGPSSAYKHWWAAEETITVTAAGGTGTPAGANLTIVNVAQGYSPDPLTVAPGATVTVSNTDPALPHTVTSDDGTSFDTGNIPAGQTDTFTAPTTPGDYPYKCSLHPSMTGTLTVA